MLGRTYDGELCSAARALEIAGERWSLLILRNAMFAGMTRYTEFQKALEIAPNILASRLAHFVESGLMETREDGGAPTYHLTKKGLDFKTAIIALTEWGDRWAAPDGPPIIYEHEGCGGRVRLALNCRKCGERVQPNEVAARVTPLMEKHMARKGRRAAPKG
jgi:DNA-binding HxlR family transcriptional regulator